MPAHLIQLRRAGACATCSQPLPARTQAWWDPGSQHVVCVACRPVDTPVSRSTEQVRPSNGAPGGSAQAEYERRRARRQQQIDQRWGRFAGLVKFLADDPQSIRAWAQGSRGERRLAADLHKVLEGTAVLLHDVRIPGSRSNIDHLAVAASGVWIINSKNYAGLVERRNKGNWLRADYRLYVDGRDRSTLAGGLKRQVEAVQAALASPEIPVIPVLCFVDAEWRLFARPFQHAGVTVTWGKKLAAMIAAPGPLSKSQVADVARRLALALPSATLKRDA